MDILEETQKKTNKIYDDGYWPICVYYPEMMKSPIKELFLLTKLNNETDAAYDQRTEKALNVGFTVYGLPGYFTKFENEIKIGYRDTRKEKKDEISRGT